MSHMNTFKAPAPEPGGKLPSCTDLAFLRGAGWSYRDLQNEYGVTNQSVQRKLALCGLTEKRVDYSEYLPWKVRPADSRKTVYKWLQVAVREDMLGMSANLEPRKRREYDRWRADLDFSDAVVEYGRARVNGEITFGFHYVPRRPGVDDWIIRKPQAWVEAQSATN